MRGVSLSQKRVAVKKDERARTIQRMHACPRTLEIRGQNAAAKQEAPWLTALFPYKKLLPLNNKNKELSQVLMLSLYNNC